LTRPCSRGSVSLIVIEACMAGCPIPREQAVSPTVGSVRHFLRDVREIALAVFVARPRWDTRVARATVAWPIAAVGVVVATLILPSMAGAHRGDGVFILAEGRWLSGRDVAMLPDGSIVGVVESRAWRLTPGGGRSSIPGLGGTGVAATADGGVLAIQGEYPPEFGDDRTTGAEHRIVRWAPGVGVSVVAGAGEQGLGGDGGPATQALLNLQPGPLTWGDPPPTGIAATPDGGFVFADTGNGRIRAVDAGGIIRTIAGSSAGTFRDPLGLAATRDGGYLVTEAGWPGFGEDGLSARVRRVGSDGTVETVAVLWAHDVVVLADGTAVIAAFDGQLWRLRPGSHSLSPYLRPKRPTDTFDFAARSTYGRRVALDPYGGLLAVGSGVLTYVPGGPTPWTLAALRGTRTRRRGVTAVIETTRPGMGTLEIAQDDRVVARVTQPVAAGHSTLRAAGPIGEDWYDVRLRLEGADGATRRDEVPIHGARALDVQLVRGLLGRNQGRDVDSNTRYTLGRDCRQFGRRRVDCVVETSDGCEVGVASVTLGRSGVVLRRDYRGVGRGRRYPCARPRFRRNPRFMASHGVRRLSRHDGRTWFPPWG
jgi:hypothetical protein